MSKYLMLKAVKHNWGLMKMGSWVSKTWSVFSDGTYEIRSEYGPVFSDEEYQYYVSTGKIQELLQKDIHTVTGRMDDRAFSLLKTQMNRKPWKDLLVECYACDGVAWEIEEYGENGSVINTGGQLGYIYGQKVLESIVHSLPHCEPGFGTSAYVSIDRMKPNPKPDPEMEIRSGLTRLIVCGGKDFRDYEFLSEKLDDLISRYEYVELVSGHAKGADTLAEIYANNNMIPIKVFPASWELYGKAAGPIRNREMLTYAREAYPAVAAFWDGKSRGTGNMLKQAKAAGVECHVFPYAATNK